MSKKKATRTFKEPLDIIQFDSKNNEASNSKINWAVRFHIEWRNFTLKTKHCDFRIVEKPHLLVKANFSYALSR